MAKSRRNRKRIRQEGNEQALEIDYIPCLFPFVSFLWLHFVVFSDGKKWRGEKKITSKDKSESEKYQKGEIRKIGISFSRSDS